jgi:hypothetical protein
MHDSIPDSSPDNTCGNPSDGKEATPCARQAMEQEPAEAQAGTPSAATRPDYGISCGKRVHVYTEKN